MKIRDRVKELRRVPAGELLPNERNWRKHPKAQQEALQGILAEIGYAGALIAYETPKGLKLIDGHLRASTTPETEVPVLVLDVDDAEAAKLLASLDPLAAMAEADAGALDSLLRDVQTGNQALADMLTNLADEAGCEWAKEQQKEVIEDEVPDPPADPVTKPGDLWLLGEHRLLCGDSTKAEDVKRLMAGEKADCVCTDPPYGIGKLMQGGTWAKKNDVQFAMMRDWDDTTSQKFFDMASSIGPAVIWGGNYFNTPASRCWLAWNKPEFPTMSSVELAWTNLDANAKNIDCPRAHQVDGKKEHATQKPLKVMAWSLGFLPKGLVYDPFLGSGSTLIAAQQLGRTCYGMEISPAYCDVIVARWEKLTGKKGKLEQ